MSASPYFRLDRYSTAAKAQKALGQTFRNHVGVGFKDVFVLWDCTADRWEKDAPVIVVTEAGQIEISANDNQGLGIGFDSINLNSTQSGSFKVGSSDFIWVPSQVHELHDLARGHGIWAIRLIGDTLKGIEIDVGSKRVRGRIQLWRSEEDCDDAYGISVAWIQPLLADERRHLVAEVEDPLGKGRFGDWG